MGSRGEADFVNFPGVAAKLYDQMMQAKVTELQYREIAQDLVSRCSLGCWLDIGTGPGRLLLEIHRLNQNVELFGLDISAAMVALAEKNLEGTGADLRQGNIVSTDHANDFFDLVTCSGSFYLWDRPEAGLDEIYRILKVGQAAYLYESHRDVQMDELRKQMRANLSGESLLHKLVAPRLMLKQLRMTYTVDEIAAIVERTRFAGSYAIDRISIAGLPIWLEANRPCWIEPNRRPRTC